MPLTSRTGPGSFIEVTKILPLLTASSAGHPSFHVVAPSLPGFAWSEGVLEKGFRAEHYAEVSDKYCNFACVLMTVLPDPALQQANGLAGLH